MNTATNKQTSACPICGSTDIVLQAPFRAKHPSYLNMDLALCSGCDMIFASPMPGEKEMRAYNESFFQINPHAGQPEDRFATAFYRGIARLRVAHIEKYLHKYKLQVNSVLELGPGPGFFAEVWKKNHANTNYYAIETDPTCHQSLQEKGIRLISTPTEVQSGVDLVVMSHVLEHVTDPRGFVADAIANLKPGGVLFIEVPCRDWEHKDLDEPHLLFFDKKPMLHLLQSLGCKHIEVGYYGQLIRQLVGRSLVGRKWQALKHKLIMNGVVWPFARGKKGTEPVTESLERAALSVFHATNIESSEAAWWLRSLAVK